MLYLWMYKMGPCRLWSCDPPHAQIWVIGVEGHTTSIPKESASCSPHLLFLILTYCCCEGRCLTCTCLSITETHTSTSSVWCGRTFVYVDSLRRFTLSVDSWRVCTWVCVSASTKHMLNKGTEMLHNAQWLTSSQMSAHHTALSIPQPPIMKTRSPWTTADMWLHGWGSDGPMCQACVSPSNTWTSFKRLHPSPHPPITTIPPPLTLSIQDHPHPTIFFLCVLVTNI